MARAVLELFPDDKLGIGPAIEKDFTYKIFMSTNHLNLKIWKGLNRRIE